MTTLAYAVRDDEPRSNPRGVQCSVITASGLFGASGDDLLTASTHDERTPHSAATGGHVESPPTRPSANARARARAFTYSAPQVYAAAAAAAAASARAARRRRTSRIAPAHDESPHGPHSSCSSPPRSADCVAVARSSPLYRPPAPHRIVPRNCVRWYPSAPAAAHLRSGMDGSRFYIRDTSTSTTRPLPRRAAPRLRVEAARIFGGVRCDFLTTQYARKEEAHLRREAYEAGQSSRRFFGNNRYVCR